MGNSKKKFFWCVDYQLWFWKSALLELNSKTNVSSLQGTAFDIAKKRKRYLQSAKISDLKIEVSKAIENFNTFNGNYEQLKVQREKNMKIKKQYEEIVKQNGIFLQL